jgi:hypothetical protein
MQQRQKRNVLIALLVAVILLTATSVQTVSAFEFTYKPWEVDHPDNPPRYIVNRMKHQAAAETDNEDEIYNAPEFDNKQSGAVNQNAQSSHFCIAWNCYQTTITTQTVTADDSSPLVYGKNNEIKTSSTSEYSTVVEDDGTFMASSTRQDTNDNSGKKTPFHIDITLKYTKPYSELEDDFIRVSVSPENGKAYEKTIDLANYNLDGSPIKTRFTFGNGEVKLGETAQVCVENLSSSLGNSCKVVTNGPEHEPESVTLVIPKSR